MFDIGDKVRLKDYHHYSDYSKHENEMATIVHSSLRQRIITGKEWNITLAWDDGGISVAKKDNIQSVDWDNKTN